MKTTQTNFDWNFIGNEALVELLEKKIVHDRLSHAYLFWGPAHVGKNTLVQRFVQSILCFYGAGSTTQNVPCRTCDHCRQIQVGAHPDVFLIERAFDEKNQKKRKNITISQIRKLQSRMNTGSFLNNYKIGIIREADTLTIEAANSLLKTLEEPHEKVILILIAKNITLLPKTLISRTQTYKLRSVRAELIAERIMVEHHDRSRARVFSQLSNGLPGIALELCRNEALFRQHQESIQLFYNCTQNDLVFRLKKAEQLFSKEQDHQDAVSKLIGFFDAWICVLRDMMMIKNAQAERNFIQNSWYYDNIVQLAQQYPNKKIIFLLEYLERAKKKLHGNINHKLLLDNFLLYL